MSARPLILVVDDDPASLELMALVLGRDVGEVLTASDGLEALRASEARKPDAIVSDLSMPNVDGLELLTLVKQRWPDVPFVLVTVAQEVETVVQAVRAGASNYLVKPVPPAGLVDAVRRAVRSSATTAPADDAMPELVGGSAAMVRVRHVVRLAARADVNVIVTGETGVGKELVARAIHGLSARGTAPFVAANCAAIPSELFESELFGHGRGAFTGADRNHDGLVLQADGGVLFLDELECLAPAHQAKLLRVLDDGMVRPVGASAARRVSVRHVAATNREPAELLRERLLREDLYYRLRGFEIHVPPLRERLEDVPALATHFLGDAAGITDDALADLACRRWPGNVRELRLALERARSVAGGAPVGVDAVHSDGTSVASASRPGPTGSGETLQDAERRAIADALDTHAGNRSHAARALGIDRSTLRRKMARLGLA